MTEVWYRRAARGAGAGAAATVAMSAVQFPGATTAGRFPPPVEISHHLHRHAGSRPPTSTIVARGVVLHLVFGATCGACYALVAPARLRELSAAAFTGALYGLSYRASLPLLRLHPHSRDDDTRRQVTNLAAHVVYGLVLAEALRLTDPPEPDATPSDVPPGA